MAVKKRGGDDQHCPEEKPPEGAAGTERKRGSEVNSTKKQLRTELDVNEITPWG